MNGRDLIKRLTSLRRPPFVPLLRLNGVIGALGPLRGGMTLQTLEPLLERAFRSRRAAAIAIAVNSPGGSPVQSALIAKRIRDLADENKRPVLAFVEDAAASGGYWLASAADEIFAQETSIVGSIGVLSGGFGFTGLLEKLGIERRLHTAGERKVLLDPFSPADSEDVERLRRVLEEVHESFKAQVRARRADRLKAPEEELFSGEFWTGRRAMELGLVDGIAEVREELRRRFGEQVQIRTLVRPRGLLRRFTSTHRPSGLLHATPEEWASGLLAAAEARALWQRYGL